MHQQVAGSKQLEASMDSHAHGVHGHKQAVPAAAACLHMVPCEDSSTLTTLLRAHAAPAMPAATMLFHTAKQVHTVCAATAFIQSSARNTQSMSS